MDEEKQENLSSELESKEETASAMAQPETAIIQGIHQNDGSLSISMDEKKLTVMADFFPPLGDGQPLTPDYIGSILERFDISYGVDWDTIQEAALECNLNRKPVRNVIVARGDPPVEEILGYYEIDPSFRRWPQLPDGDLPKIDYRELSPFVVVKKDQPLANFRPRSSGRTGKNIHGDEIPMPIRRPESMVAGENTRQNDQAIVAIRDGRLVENGKVLVVEEVLAVKGSVGYQTGHIVFPGDVIIDGDVADGFKVYSGGSILSKQTFDATDVVAKKDLIVTGGIIGRGKASVKAGGTCRAKFIQNCRVAARGSILVQSAVINSSIYTLDKLDLSDKGRIIGTEVYAVHGVRAASIGSEGSKTCEIHCGIDFTAKEELHRVNQQIKVLSLKAGKAREMLEAESTPEERKARLNNYYKKLQIEHGKLVNQVTELLGKIYANEQAVVEINGEVMAGTMVEICNVNLILDKTQRKVRFRLDKKQGKLVHEPYK